MMRLRMASLIILVSLGLLAVGTAPAALAGAAKGSPPHAWRTVGVSLSPAPSDLALVEIEFHGTRGRQSISRRTLALTLGMPIGGDYFAVATPSYRPSSTPRVFVLIVNRPTPLLDPARIALRVQTLRSLGAPRPLSLANPFTQRVVGLTPALCDLPLHGAPTLQGSALRTLRSQGAALAGYGPAAAVAQAYDVACALPSEAAFAQALGHPSGGECSSVRALCCPPNAICATPVQPPAPAPTPPAPGPPPSCTPCSPPPGYACPLVASRVCPAVLPAAARRASAGSH